MRELKAEQAAIKSIKWITPIARSSGTHVGMQQDQAYRDILKSPDESAFRWCGRGHIVRSDGIPRTVFPRAAGDQSRPSLAAVPPAGDDAGPRAV
jgi:hypothetical protein